ncbi:helix-turn-helix domain-containing protein [[Ruminococcus] torques]|jgi:transcriptional regulator with XRE-family HTH domain|uniref:helix-turn-helix domain-containing protein n=1 Tax=[Ruminococcus] torques TaxID=33039 RepID=UPI003AF0A148
MLGNTLKECMKEKGIKQGFVAEKIGVSPQIMGQLLNGQRKIEVSEYFRICEAIDVDPIECAVKEGIFKVQQATA